MLRKLILTGFVLLVPERMALVRILLAIIVSLLYLVLTLAYQPFKKNNDDAIAVGGQICILCIFIGAGYVKLFNDLSDTTSLEVAQEVMGFQSSVEIVAIMLCFTFSLLLLVVLVTGYKVWKEGKLPQIRELRTLSRPELTLGTNQRFHLFLSHIWGSGQDQARVIKSQLQMLLPGVYIFLDVDDLEDITMLEEYIDQSNAILMFLSRGFFDSRNCLREANRAVETNKQIILVREVQAHNTHPNQNSNPTCPPTCPPTRLPTLPVPALSPSPLNPPYSSHLPHPTPSYPRPPP